MDWEEEKRSAKNDLVENSDERTGGVEFRLATSWLRERYRSEGRSRCEGKQAIPLTSKNRKWTSRKSSVGYNMGWSASQSSGRSWVAALFDCSLAGMKRLLRLRVSFITYEYHIPLPTVWHSHFHHAKFPYRQCYMYACIWILRVCLQWVFYKSGAHICANLVSEYAELVYPWLKPVLYIRVSQDLAKWGGPLIVRDGRVGENWSKGFVMKMYFYSIMYLLLDVS